MKLYCVQVAPNPTKVRLYIAEKRALGCEMDIEEITIKLIKGEQRQPEHLKRNPFGTIPVLEIAGDDFLIESLPIIEYLEERYPQPSLLGGEADTPHNIRRRAQARELERIAETKVLNPVAEFIHATKSPLNLPPQPEIAARAERRMPLGLAYFDDLLADGRDYLCGNEVTVADCTLAAALQFSRFAELSVLEPFPRLAQWDQHYRERDSAKSVLVI